MKGILTFAFCFYFLIDVVRVTAQSNPILGSFAAYENNGKIFLKWQIVAGSTCNGIQIYHSTDSLSFVQIGNIPGICGSSSDAVSYDFTDGKPVKNAINYYRLEFGNAGESNVLSVELISIESGYQIRPNPASSHTRIYFGNKNGLPFQLLVYDNFGNIRQTVSTRYNYIDLDTSGFSNGLYFFSIIDPEKRVDSSGKFIVLN